MSRLLALFLILLIAVNASAAFAGKAGKAGKTENPEANRQAYFKDKEKGWFWYLEELERKKAANDPKKEDKAKAGPKKKRLEEMTTDELKSYSEKKLKAALNDPADFAKVREYMIVQKYILDRAQLFTRTWQQVLLLYPDLDWTVEHPVSATGLDIYKQEEENRISEVITGLAKAGGLFFFFDSACPYCREQARILKAFEYTYGMAVFPVSLNGGALPEFPDYRKDNGMAQRLGIERVPAIVLAVPPKDLVPISSGIVTLSEIKQRIYSIATNSELFQRAAIRSGD